MAETIVHHVTITSVRGYEFVASFNDLPEAGPMFLDEPPPLGEGRGPGAAALLATAVGNCLAASLLFCLRKTRAQIGTVTANVAAHVERNDAGRFRIMRLDVELTPEVASQDAGRLARCQDLFEDFCIVTESVRRGIPVDVKVKELEGAVL